MSDDRRPRCERCGGLKALRARPLCRNCEIAESGGGQSPAVAVPRVDLRWRVGTAVLHVSDRIEDLAWLVRRAGSRYRMKGRS